MSQALLRDTGPDIHTRVGTYGEAEAHFEHVQQCGCDHHAVMVTPAVLLLDCPRCREGS